jgi:hypothetical protein
MEQTLEIDLTHFYEIICPHCDGIILVHRNELFCRIFRHGVFIFSLQQIPSHASKEECDGYVTSNMIYGCGKPFKIEEPPKAVICDYI